MLYSFLRKVRFHHAKVTILFQEKTHKTLFFALYFVIRLNFSNFAHYLQIEIMPEIFPINIIELILKGMLIGIIASAPMGPVGILCVQRTLNKGRWPGFATGVGASISDMIYALLTGFGISFTQEFITQPTPAYILKVVGSILLLGFGIYCFRSKPRHIHTQWKE